eukprot:gene29580-36654_t
MTPNQIVTGVKLDLNKRLLVPFGTVAMLHHAGRTQQKFDPRSEMGIILGTSELTYGSVRAYLFRSSQVVDRSEFVPVAYFPTSFPWPLKSTSINLTDVLIKSQEGANRVIRVNAAEQNSSVSFSSTKPNSLLTSAIKLADTCNNNTADTRQVRFGYLPTSVPTAQATPSGGAATTNKRKQPDGGHADFDSAIASPLSRSSDFSLSREGDFSMNRDTQTILVEQPTEQSRPPVVESYSNALPTESSAPNRTDHSEDASHSQRSIDPQLSSLLNGAQRDGTSARRSGRPTPSSWKDGPPRYSTKRLNKTFQLSMTKALESHKRQESLEAMRDEVMNMLTYKVGHYVNYKDLTSEQRRIILQSFMFLKHKTKPDGSYDRTKARMVGNGANQKEHMYDLISSSTVALSSVFLLFNLASYYKCDLCSYDVKGAFLNAEFGPNDVKTYIKVNKEITAIWVEMDPSALPFVDSRGELLLELDKFIYGLKQSPYKFQQHLRDFLLGEGYEQMTNDDCLFIKHTSDPAKFSVISIHVDDILQVSTCPLLVTALHEALIRKYGTITFNPNAEAYIGMSIDRSADRGTITLSQVGLIDKILDTYASGDTRTNKDPHTENLFFPDDSEEPCDPKRFLSLIMSLMYLARLTRPDILLSTVFLASRYLRGGTKHRGVRINCTGLDVRVICDASYQVHSDGKSHTGYIVTMGDNYSYVHSRSAKQKLTATSSTDAEVLAMVESLKQATWIRNILIELRICPRAIITLYQDNRNLLTKPLHGEPFQKHRRTLMGM